MFTFGIFTTHLPYIAFVFFYAYFLIFGIEKGSNGQIQISEKSITVEFHLNSFSEDSFSNSVCYYHEINYSLPKDSVEETDIKQKWKTNKNFAKKPEIFVGNALFCRPPPALA